MHNCIDTWMHMRYARTYYITAHTHRRLVLQTCTHADIGLHTSMYAYTCYTYIPSSTTHSFNLSRYRKQFKEEWSASIFLVNVWRGNSTGLSLQLGGIQWTHLICSTTWRPLDAHLTPTSDVGSSSSLSKEPLTIVSNCVRHGSCIYITIATYRRHRQAGPHQRQEWFTTRSSLSLW